MLDEFGECEEAARRSPAFREAMKKRGIEDLSLVMIDAWSAGHYGNEPPEDRGKRLCPRLVLGPLRAQRQRLRPTRSRTSSSSIDLNRKEVVRVEDYGVVPLPPQAGNWARQYVKETRADLKPLEVIAAGRAELRAFAATRSHGRSGRSASASTRARGWCSTRSRYDGRPVLYRASIAEMIVPYADPKASSYHKNVFDLGEYGVGMLANSLALGCDCLGTIRYFDAHLADSRGRLVTIKNAICLHEEDFGMLWKHTDWRTSQSEVRRSRRLAVSMVATVGNYDYGFYWYFYQDGTIQMEVKLTGIVNTTGAEAGRDAALRHRGRAAAERPVSSALSSTPGSTSPSTARTTPSRRSTRGAVPAGPENPYGNAFTPRRRRS